MDSNNATQADHRRMKRKTAAKTTAIICRRGTLGLGPNVALRIEDLSPDGAQLWVKVPMKKGDELEITLQPAGFGKTIVRRASVMWCAGQQGAEHRVGIKFDKTLDYHELFVMTG